MKVFCLQESTKRRLFAPVVTTSKVVLSGLLMSDFPNLSSSSPDATTTSACPAECGSVDEARQEEGHEESKASKNVEEGRQLFFLAVHVGAGYNAPSNAKARCRAMRRACAAAASVLSQSSGRSIDAVVSAIRVLEDDEITNAGRGSNLTEDGVVECDASIMDVLTGVFGTVGAAPGIKHAIKVAELLAKESLAGLLSLGQSPPMYASFKPCAHSSKDAEIRS